MKEKSQLAYQKNNTKTLEQFQKYCRPFYEVELYQGQLNLSVHVEWCYKKTRYANHKTINPHYFNLELHNTFNTINIIQVHDNIILIILLSARAYFFNEHTQVNCKNGHRLTWGPFLETPDNFPGPVSIFSSSFIYQLMVIIGANLAISFTKL